MLVDFQTAHEPDYPSWGGPLALNPECVSSVVPVGDERTRVWMRDGSWFLIATPYEGVLARLRGE